MNLDEKENGVIRHPVKGAIELLLAALIWGFAFVAQSVGMRYVGPFTFNTIRNLIGAAVLVPCIFFLDAVLPERRRAKEEAAHRTDAEKKAARKVLLRGGLVCGFFLALAGNLQQVGIKYTEVGKAGFITALYIVLVPVFGIFLHKKAGLKIWISVGIAVAGLYMLCMSDSFSVGKGDGYTLCSAFAFAFQILAIDYYVDRTDGVKLAFMEFLVCGILSGVLMLLFETPSWTDIVCARVPILYAGILSCGAAYTLQIVGQKELAPTVASLIMSLESVISALAGWLILKQTLSTKELSGCALMFVAIILAQLPEKKKESDVVS